MMRILACFLWLLAGTVHGGAVAGADPGGVEAVANGARLQLRWELQRSPAGTALTQDGSPARFVLGNHDTAPLPARGWSLYFNAPERMPLGHAAAGLVLEQIAGGLFRLRPGPDFPGLAPGQTLVFTYRHSDAVFTSSKAPGGPYLVYDAAPEVGVALDYAVVPLAEAPRRSGAGEHALVTPQDTYRRNARAPLLAQDAVPKVIPTPLSMTTRGGRLALAGPPQIDAARPLANEAALARSLFPAVAGPRAGAPLLRLRVGRVAGQSSPEAYRLRIRAATGIDIVGNSPAGVAWGVQTLRELMPLPGAHAPSLPEVDIVDAPRFGYRGFMLDVARNFHGKEVVFKWLDLMARLKLNTFHFHLTDDEGWRLEIAGLPELTAIGAVRGHAAQPGIRLEPAYGSGPDPNDASGSGHFSRADYVAILRYAAARHIEVIPEIEMPGHARAAVQAMEARYHRLRAAGDPDAAKYLLNDLADASQYSSPQMLGDNVINPGHASTYAFIAHVVGDIVAMHREAGVGLRTIHMGGDELAAGAWEKSPVSRALMAREGLASTAELWDYFYDRVDAILRRHGLRTSGWEELAARRAHIGSGPALVPNPRFTGRGFTAYVWNNTPGNEDLANRLANGGYDVVLAPVTRMYLDMAHNANPAEHGVNWGAYVELETVYDFIPFAIERGAMPSSRGAMEALLAASRRRVRGIQANLFTETVRTHERLDYLAMPRLVAVAERAWAADPAWARAADPVKAEALRRHAWTGFVNALGQRVLPRLDLEGEGLAYRIAPPGLVVEGEAVLANHVLPGTQLRYTVDGSAPDATSRVVDGPILAAGTVRVAAFDRRGRRGEVATLLRPVPPGARGDDAAGVQRDPGDDAATDAGGAAGSAGMPTRIARE